MPSVFNSCRMKVVCILLSTPIYIGVSAQSDSTMIPEVKKGLVEMVSDPMIRTVQLQYSTLELAYPILPLNTDGQFLTLSFDDLHGGVKDYYYTFTHCDQQWEPSGLTSFDIIDGFDESRISDYQFSFGTLQRYTHYAVSFPNEEVQFRLSGNYIVQVWKDEDRDTPILTKRFFVWEQEAAIDAKVMRPNLIPYRNEFQEINFNVDVRNIDVHDAFDDIRVTVLQNGRFDNASYNLKPRMVTNDMLMYDIDDLVFPGGKEYRRFDTKTLKFQTDRITKIQQQDGQYHVYVNVDESRVYQRYTYEKDANGQYVIQAELSDDVNKEGDYAWIHFTLQYPYVITSGNVFVIGEGMQGDTTLQAIPMTYNYDRQQYEAKAYLKQGYYNYQYALLPQGASYYALDYTEGNTYESENDYVVLVYLHMFDKDYDRLIGCTVVNSVK